MIPPIFETIVNHTAARDSLTDSSGIVRFFPFGEIEIPDGGQSIKPYATWQIIGGYPENFLACRPDIDLVTTQIDVWAESASECYATARRVRDAVEGPAYVTHWDATGRDYETRLYRFVMTVDWWTDRDATEPDIYALLQENWQPIMRETGSGPLLTEVQ